MKFDGNEVETVPTIEEAVALLNQADGMLAKYNISIMVITALLGDPEMVMLFQPLQAEALAWANDTRLTLGLEGIE